MDSGIEFDRSNFARLIWMTDVDPFILGQTEILVDCLELVIAEGFSVPPVVDLYPEQKLDTGDFGIHGGQNN